MTLPRTTASALLSPASRSPSRRWNASSTASFTSFVSAGSAVWLSKGRMATVLMFGSPPPAKPYRHPLSARASVLTAPAPNRRIEHRRRVHHDHRKLKTSPLLREIHAGARRHPLGVEFGAAARQHLPLSPPLRLEDARAATRLPIIERVAVLREPPDADTRVRAPSSAPAPTAEDQGVRRGRPHDAERRPQHPHRRDQRAEILLRIRPDRRIGDDGGRARTESQRPHVIEPQRIRRCDASAAWPESKRRRSLDPLGPTAAAPTAPAGAGSRPRAHRRQCRRVLSAGQAENVAASRVKPGVGHRWMLRMRSPCPIAASAPSPETTRPNTV